MLPMGGYVGGADAFGGASKHLRAGNPHSHMNLHLVNAYQHGTLKTVGEAIRARTCDVEQLKSFHMHPAPAARQKWIPSSQTGLSMLHQSMHGLESCFRTYTHHHKARRCGATPLP